MENNLDPATQLKELRNAQDAAAVEAWVPPTPLWHAPLLGLFVVSIAALIEGPTELRIPALFVAGVTAAFGFWDSLSRRNARPRGLRKPFRINAFVLATIAIPWLLLAATSAAVAEVADSWSSQPGSAVFMLIGIWLMTSVLFVASIWTTNTWRNKWLKAAR